MGIGNFIAVALLASVFCVLIAGVVLMSVGGKANAKYSHRLMTMRVTLQGLALAMLALLFFLGHK